VRGTKVDGDRIPKRHPLVALGYRSQGVALSDVRLQSLGFKGGQAHDIGILFVTRQPCCTPCTQSCACRAHAPMKR
jgi:hypothetical protein